jgi:hypothetical protein
MAFTTALGALPTWARMVVVAKVAFGMVSRIPSLRGWCDNNIDNWGSDSSDSDRLLSLRGMVMWFPLLIPPAFSLFVSFLRWLGFLSQCTLADTLVHQVLCNGLCADEGGRP